MLSVANREQFHEGTNHLKQERKKKTKNEMEQLLLVHGLQGEGSPSVVNIGKSEVNQISQHKHRSLHKNSALCLTFAWWHRGLYHVPGWMLLGRPPVLSERGRFGKSGWVSAFLHLPESPRHGRIGIAWRHGSVCPGAFPWLALLLPIQSSCFSLGILFMGSECCGLCTDHVPRWDTRLSALFKP